MRKDPQVAVRVKARAAGRFGGWNETAMIVSVVVGLAAAFILFVSFLQTPEVSPSRLALAGGLMLGISGVNYVALTKWLSSSLQAIGGQRTRRSIALCLILPAIFLPLVYREPSYPVSPLLRAWSDVKIRFVAAPSNAVAAQLPRSAIKLDLGRNRVINRHGFDPNGPWEHIGDTLAITGGSSVSLEWAGQVPQTATLTLIPPAIDGSLTISWDDVTSNVALHADTAEPFSLQKAFAVPWGYSLSLLFSMYIVISWALTIAWLAFQGRLEGLPALGRSKVAFGLMMLLVVLLSVATVQVQVANLPTGPGYVDTEQVFRHVQVMTGQADNPWQYRVLSDGLVELAIRAMHVLSIPDAYATAFIGVRILQNLAIFLLAFALYAKLFGSRLLAVLGILILASSMLSVFYDSDLSFNVYFDVVFYLLAAILLLRGRYFGVAILMLFASLNRETSAAIPVLLIAAIFIHRDSPDRNFMPVALSVGIFIVVFVGLRLAIPDRPLFIPHQQPPGPALLTYNLTRQLTWSDLFTTLGLVPLVGLASFGSWPRLWKAFFWILCPAWFAIHFVAGVVAETRLFLVPQALIFIPGALFSMMYLLKPDVPRPPSAATNQVE
jgi:hypothetical protein